jgi:predicted metal-binding membrane protein
MTLPLGGRRAMDFGANADRYRKQTIERGRSHGYRRQPDRPDRRGLGAAAQPRRSSARARRSSQRNRPHGSSAAAAAAIAAGVYELTPLKRHFRRRCRESVHSGLGLGISCVGSSIRLMLMLLALGVMSATWMSVIAVLVLAQKLLPPRAAMDVPLALAIVALGVLIAIALSSLPGLMPTM